MLITAKAGGEDFVGLVYSEIDMISKTRHLKIINSVFADFVGTMNMKLLGIICTLLSRGRFKSFCFRHPLCIQHKSLTENETNDCETKIIDSHNILRRLARQIETKKNFETPTSVGKFEEVGFSADEIWHI